MHEHVASCTACRDAKCIVCNACMFELAMHGDAIFTESMLLYACCVLQIWAYYLLVDVVCDVAHVSPAWSLPHLSLVHHCLSATRSQLSAEQSSIAQVTRKCHMQALGDARLRLRSGGQGLNSGEHRLHLSQTLSSQHQQPLCIQPHHHSLHLQSCGSACWSPCSPCSFTTIQAF